MVTLPRRLAALVIALIATSLAGTALGSPRDVINDFKNNQVIDGCYTRADYEAARNEPVDISYGDLQGAIDVALADPAHVGTAERPCPEAPDTESGSNAGTVAIVVVGAGLGLLAIGSVIASRRRRSGVGPDPDDPADGGA